MSQEVVTGTPPVNNFLQQILLLLVGYFVEDRSLLEALTLAIDFGMDGQISNSEDSGAAQTSTATSQTIYEPKWPELPATAKYITRTRWQRHAIPRELRSLPDDIHVPEKLQQILDWSLTPGTAWALPPPPPPVDDADEGGEADDIDDQDDDAEEDADPQDLPLSVDDSATASTSGGQSLRPSESKSIRSRNSVRQPTRVASRKLPETEEKSAWKRKFLRKIARKKQSSEPVEVARPVIPTAECTSCFEELPTTELAQMEVCRHYYCKSCLNMLITTAMATESSFPPKCCLSPIPIHTVLLSLSEEQREQYQLKSAEYTLAPSDRWYCPRSTCARWIPPSDLVAHANSNFTCPSCSEAICRTCRGTAHTANTECPQDYGLVATLETAELEGWRRCHNCHAMVEHTRGCRHMTCRCRAQFCYVCGAVWCTCHCTEEDAQRRRADLRRRREERIAAADAEAAEVARIIAEVQELERLIAERQRQEEERQAREEAEQLAALEQQRQMEEAARQAEEEEAERLWQEVVKNSFEDDVRQLETLMGNIIEFQRAQMIIRHETDNSARETELAFLEMGTKAKFEALIQNTNERYAKQDELLRSEQRTETESLEAQQEEEEDDMFVQIQVRLRGKTNKEARMERMLGELRKTHADTKAELVQKHTQALYTLQVRKKVDLTGIKGAQEEETTVAQTELDQKLCQLGFSIGADRQWFELVAQRRMSMLTSHREIGAAEIENNEEPSGLRDWHAATCEPTLPDIENNNDEDPEPSNARPHGHETSQHARGDSIQIQISQDPYDGRRSRISGISELDGQSVHVTSPTAAPIQPDNSSSYFNEGAYLQPVAILPHPGRPPPTPPSSSVSIEAFHARVASKDSTTPRQEDVASSPRLARNSASDSFVPLTTIATNSSLSPVSPTSSNPVQRYYSRPEVVTSSDLYTSAFLPVRPEPSRKDSSVTTTSSIESTDRRRESESLTTKRKSRFGFGRKKELTPEEIREKMRQGTAGSAF